MKSVSTPAPAKSKLMCVLVFGIFALSTSAAHAQSFSVIHNFTGGSDGGNPVNGFTTNASGALFGTASSGGAFDKGIVFKIALNGEETVLHSFGSGLDGASPNAGLTRTKSSVYFGTTTAGGASGNGTVFKISGTKEIVLYSFAGGTDGADPEAGLILDAAGNLYGTTSGGGGHGNGTVFKLTPSKDDGKWTETILYGFGPGTDGAVPVGGVSLDVAGNLYGSTSAGGAYGYGRIFELTPGLTTGTAWTETVIHDFQNADDGAVPYAGLIADQSGNFYGAATEGGANGGGTIFKLTPSNGNWAFDVIYSVPGWGIAGSFRDVMFDPTSGNLYGTTHCDGAYNSGTVYQLTPSATGWTYTLLYTFTGGQDGLYSFSNLALNKGKLYGTTKYGGTLNNGVIFEVTP